MYLKLEQINAVMTCVFIGYFLIQHFAFMSQADLNYILLPIIALNKNQFKKEFLVYVRFILQ